MESSNTESTKSMYSYNASAMCLNLGMVSSEMKDNVHMIQLRLLAHVNHIVMNI